MGWKIVPISEVSAAGPDPADSWVNPFPLPAEPAAQTPEQDPGFFSQFGGQFPVGLKRDWAGLKSYVPMVGALGAELFNLPQTRDMLTKDFTDRQQAIAEMPQARISRIEDVNNLGDLGAYLGQGIGGAVPSMGAMMLPGGVGAGLARRAALKEAAALGLPELEAAAMANQAAVKAGTMTALGTSGGLESGSIGGDIYQDTGQVEPSAMIGGALAGALDAYTPSKFFGKALGTVSRQALGREVLGGMLGEGSTEALQSVIERLNRGAYTPEQGLMTPQGWSDVLNSGIIGGVVGGGMGGFQGGLNAMANRGQPPIEGESREIPPEEVALDEAANQNLPEHMRNFVPQNGVPPQPGTVDYVKKLRDLVARSEAGIQANNQAAYESSIAPTPENIELAGEEGVPQPTEMDRALLDLHQAASQVSPLPVPTAGLEAGEMSMPKTKPIEMAEDLDPATLPDVPTRKGLQVGEAEQVTIPPVEGENIVNYEVDGQQLQLQDLGDGRHILRGDKDFIARKFSGLGGAWKNNLQGRVIPDDLVGGFLYKLGGSKAAETQVPKISAQPTTSVGVANVKQETAKVAKPRKLPAARPVEAGTPQLESTVQPAAAAAVQEAPVIPPLPQEAPNAIKAGKIKSRVPVQPQGTPEVRPAAEAGTGNSVQPAAPVVEPGAQPEKRAKARTLTLPKREETVAPPLARVESELAPPEATEEELPTDTEVASAAAEVPETRPQRAQPKVRREERVQTEDEYLNDLLDEVDQEAKHKKTKRQEPMQARGHVQAAMEVAKRLEGTHPRLRHLRYSHELGVHERGKPVPKRELDQLAAVINEKQRSAKKPLVSGEDIGKAAVANTIREQGIASLERTPQSTTLWPDGTGRRPDGSGQMTGIQEMSEDELAYAAGHAVDTGEDENLHVVNSQFKSKKDAITIQALAELHGLRVFPFKYAGAKVESPSYGFVVEGEPDTIYLNTEADVNIPMAVMMHEIAHTMEERNPELHTKLVQAVLKTQKPGAIEKYREARGMHGAKDDFVQNEIVADVLAQHAHRPEFWDQVFSELAGSEKDLLQKIIDFIVAQLKRVIDYATSQTKHIRDMGEFVRNVEATRNIFANAQAKYIKDVKKLKNPQSLQEARQNRRPGEYRNTRSMAGAYFSALGKAVEDIKQKQAPAAQWLGMIQNLTQKGVKQEELAWSGVQDWLKSQEGTVTKEQLQDYLKSQDVDIQEVVKGENAGEKKTGYFIRFNGDWLDLSPNDQGFETKDQAYEAFNDWFDDIYIGRGKTGIEKQADGTWKIWSSSKDLDVEASYPTEAKAQDALDAARSDERVGAQDLVEILKRTTNDEEIDQRHHTEFDDADYNLPGGTKYRELLITLKQPEIKGEPYHVVHDKLMLPVLEKVFPNDRHIENGMRRYVTGQRDDEAMRGGEALKKLRKEGYGETVDAFIAAFDVSKKIEEQRKNEFIEGHYQEPNVLVHLRFNERTDKDGKKVLFIEEVQSDWHQKGRKRGYVNTEEEVRKDAASVISTKPVPDAPFKNSETWGLLAIKRAIRWAAEHGYDKVAWTTGAQQGKRWGGNFVRTKGMEGFYDKILPKAVEQYVKRLDPSAKPRLEELGDAGLIEEQKKSRFSTQWVLPITDKIKEAALYKGQPKFQAPFKSEKTQKSGPQVLSTVELSQMLGDMVEKIKTSGLGFLGRRQIVDLYKDKVEALPEYDRLMDRMASERNAMETEADQLVEKWQKVTDQKQLAEVMNEATLAKVDPSEKDTKLDSAKYKELKPKYDKLSPEAKAVYKEARDAYRRQMKQVQQELQNRIDRSAMAPESRTAMKRDIERRMNEGLTGIYFPLSRFGDYFVTVRSGDGNIVYREHAPNRKQAELIRQKLSKEYPKGEGNTVSNVSLVKDFNPQNAGASSQFMQQLHGLIEETSEGEAQLELIDAVNQLYLRTLPDNSWAQKLLHRKGTPGYSQEARRAFAAHMVSGARHLAKLRYLDRLQDSLTEMQLQVDSDREGAENFDAVAAQRAVNEIAKRHRAAISFEVSSLSSLATATGFFWHLGLSPSAAAINILQTPLVAFPVLGSKYGFGEAANALGRAMATTAAGKNNLVEHLQGEERGAVRRAIEEGVIETTQARDLANVASGADTGYMANVKEKLKPIARASAFMFHHAERFNRQATFLAAYRLAKVAGDADPYASAVKLTYTAHFDYAETNRPRYFQGNMARIFLLFKQYAQNMIYTLGKSMVKGKGGWALMDPKASKEEKEAARLFASVLAMHAVAAGMLGLSVVGIILAAASAIGGSDDDPWDAKIALRNYMADAIGPKAAEVLMRGVPRIADGPDIASRVGLDSMILRDGPEGLDGVDQFRQFMISMLGPVVGIGDSMARASDMLAAGDWQRAWENMTPKVLRDPIKAWRYANEGVQDRTGIEIIPETTVAEDIFQVLGFSPARASEAYAGVSAVKQAKQGLDRVRQRILDQYSLGLLNNDNDAVAEAEERMNQFNENNPDMAINSSSLNAAAKKRQTRRNEAEAGVYLPQKLEGLREQGRFAASAFDNYSADLDGMDADEAQDYFNGMGATNAAALMSDLPDGIALDEGTE